MWRYRIAGIEVATDIPLPGAQIPASVATVPEVTIRRGPVPQTLDGATSSGGDWMMRQDSFLWRVPHVARFLIRGGREIEFSVEDAADEGDVVIYLLGSAFGILLHQRGYLVLHASAVEVRGKAVLFCGPSGAGKSTLAAALSNAGYAFLNDDVCHIRVDGGIEPKIAPDGRFLKLWGDALHQLTLEDRKGAAVGKSLDKFYVAPPDARRAEAVPLGAAYGLRAGSGAQPIAFEKLDAAQAVMLFRENAYRPLLVSQMKLERSYFTDSIAALRRANAFYLTRPIDYSAMAEMIRRLERHWAEIGL